ADAGNELSVIKMTNTTSSKPPLQFNNISVPTYTFEPNNGGPDAPNPTNTNGSTIRTNDTRVQCAAMRGSQLVVAQNVVHSGTVSARWYRFQADSSISLQDSGEAT